MDSRTFTVYFQRHGDKDGDSLTEKGDDQVANAARRAIRVLPIHLAICTDTNRTLGTLHVAMRAVCQDDRIIDMVIEPMFSANVLPPCVEDNWPYDNFLEELRQTEQQDGPRDLAYTFRTWPAARVYRTIHLVALEKWVRHVSEEPWWSREETPVLYVAGHSTGCFCAPSQHYEQIPAILEPGGIVKYGISLKPDFHVGYACHCSNLSI